MGKPFRLTSILKHRKDVERMLRGETADAHRAALREKEELTLKIDLRHQAIQALEVSDAPHSESNPDIPPRHGRDYQLREAYIQKMNTKIQHQKDKVDKVVSVVEEKRAVLVEAMKNRKIIDHLKQRHDDAERMADRSAEQRLLDEIAITARLRRRLINGKKR